MDEDAAAAAESRSPSPSSSGASPSPRTKRRRTDRYAHGFEFAPRPASATAPAPAAPARTSPPEWTEDSTFALLDSWGDRFVRAGRRSLRADEWLEVSRVAAAAASRPAGYYSESQCRNRIDTLRKKFRKEKERLRLAARRAERRADRPSPSKWIYFDKMQSLMSPPSLPLQPPVVTRRRDTQPTPRHSWGLDAAEQMLLLSAGGKAVTRDSGSDAELVEVQINEAGAGKRKDIEMLAESIRKLGDVYERVESSKRQHIDEMDRMRRDLQRDLELRRREILEKAQAEIACLCEEDGVESSDLEDREGEGDDNKRIGDDGSDKEA
uniref:Myb/SANT-like DNA-binding domain-containing protein n=1 Tax=Leersia perrieri TaxID=77586 RepID=A0A0D9V501_9ORYZ